MEFAIDKKMSLQNQINVNDLKGQGNIDQCRNYIVKAGMIDLKELNKEWKLKYVKK